MKFATTVGLVLAVVLAAAQAVAAPPTVKQIELNGETIHVTSAIPPELEGTYLYEQQGEPIIELKKDGTGTFQPHGVAGIPVTYWLRSDEAGVPLKKLGEGNPNYMYVIVLQYGPGGGGNYPEGGYGMWAWARDVAGGCAIILGERYKCG